MNQVALNWAVMFIEFYKHANRPEGFRIRFEMVNKDDRTSEEDTEPKDNALELSNNKKDINDIMKRRHNINYALATGDFIAIFPVGKGKKLPDAYPEWELTREDLDKMGIDEDNGTHT